MKACPKCNAEFPDTACYCMACGTALSVGAPDGAVLFAGDETLSQDAVPKKIETHLIKAIIAAVCCCLPFGIVAIIFAAQTSAKLQARDAAGAAEAGKKANMWANLSIGIGIILQILWLGLYKFTLNNMLFEFMKSAVN